MWCNVDKKTEERRNGDGIVLFGTKQKKSRDTTTQKTLRLVGGSQDHPVER
jgi:hypothetical protein